MSELVACGGKQLTNFGLKIQGASCEGSANFALMTDDESGSVEQGLLLIPIIRVFSLVFPRETKVMCTGILSRIHS